MPRPLVAIVGRPNVGKSTLFNRLAGKRLSVVDDTPGVTRDRIYAQTDWNGYEFDIVDTGGIELRADTEMLIFMREQAMLAIETSDVIIFMTDITTGLTAADEEVARMLQKSGRPVILAVNKADGTGHTNPDIFEFYKLGLGDPIGLSSTHGHGTGDLLDACIKLFPDYKQDNKDNENDDIINVAVIGKPNAGKSSLVNRILGEKRTIVSETAGTTRDAIDTKFENDSGKYIFIDTAGIRRKTKIDSAIEYYSVLRAKLAIDRAHVCIIMIDARDGVTEQDTKVAGLAHDSGKACIIAVNKWDLVEKETGTMEKLRKEITKDLPFMTYAPVIFISALTGQRVNKLFDLINYVNEQSVMRITTGKLNAILADATGRVQPPSDKGRRLKVFYITQTNVRPPEFVCFCNDKKLFHFSYMRYIENQIRSVFGLEGTPIRMIARERKEDL